MWLVLYHLLIVDVGISAEYWTNRLAHWNGIRRISFIPVMSCLTLPSRTHTMVELGADICVSGKHYLSVVADLAFAQM